jgi:membrane peptidoglycan carboxypeptidase
VYFGDGAYGIESAAKHYFSTTADKLTLTQSAMLAGLVRDPRGLDVSQNSKGVLMRRNLVFARMVHEKMISAQDGEAAAKTGLGLHISKASQGCYYSSYPFFCDYAEEVLLADPALGKDEEERRRLLYRGGLTIRSTLDIKAQKATQKAVSSTVAPSRVAGRAGHRQDQGDGAVAGLRQGQGQDVRQHQRAAEVQRRYRVLPRVDLQAVRVGGGHPAGDPAVD